MKHSTRSVLVSVATLWMASTSVWGETPGNVMPNVTDETALTTASSVPKCCGINEAILDIYCGPANKTIEQVEYGVYSTNKTHIDSVKINKTLNFYVSQLNCPEPMVMLKLTSDDIIGIIFNSSILPKFPGPPKFIAPTEYCMDYEIKDSGEDIVFVYCTNVEAALFPNLYFAFLILSALCFFSLALYYVWVIVQEDEEKSKIVHKKCFVGYSSSMAITFSVLILLQKAQSFCGVLGSLFFLSMLSSFSWMACLYIEMVLLVWFFNEAKKDYFYWYLAASLMLPISFYCFSLIPNGIPDIPNSFITSPRGYYCQFPGERGTIFFTPIGIYLLISLISLALKIFIFRKNQTNYKNDVTWLSKITGFKFTWLRCILIFILNVILFLVELSLSILGTPGEENLRPFHLITSLQGVFVIATTVVHCWERRHRNRRLTVVDAQELEIFQK